MEKSLIGARYRCVCRSDPVTGGWRCCNAVSCSLHSVLQKKTRKHDIKIGLETIKSHAFLSERLIYKPRGPCTVHSLVAAARILPPDQLVTPVKSRFGSEPRTMNLYYCLLRIRHCRQPGTADNPALL